MKTGRKQSIPDAVIGNVGEWHRQGFGCRRIAKLLEQHQVFTTRGSVHRLIRGLPPYATKSPVREGPPRGVQHDRYPGMLEAFKEALAKATPR